MLMCHIYYIEFWVYALDCLHVLQKQERNRKTQSRKGRTSRNFIKFIIVDRAKNILSYIFHGNAFVCDFIKNRNREKYQQPQRSK